MSECTTHKWWTRWADIAYCLVVALALRLYQIDTLPGERYFVVYASHLPAQNTPFVEHVTMIDVKPDISYNLVEMVVGKDEQVMPKGGKRMERVWQLTEEDTQFTEVVDEAMEHGPQVVSKDGREVAVVISMEEYRQMKQRQSLGEFFRLSPLAGLEELDLERDRTPLDTRIEF